MSHDWRQHWQHLDQLLRQFASFWQPIPFHTPQPAWTDQAPALHAWVSGLSATDCQSLQDHFDAAITAASDLLPTLRALHDLARLPIVATLDTHTLSPLTDTPLRKALQVYQLSHALQPLRQPMVDWCCGKGHLARVLSQQSGHAVVGYERDHHLVDAGNTLAARHAPSVRLVQRDVLQPWDDTSLNGQHCVALHACGDLHRQLLRIACAHDAARISLSPCCYHLAHAGMHQPLSCFVQQQPIRCRLSAEQMRLVVQETVTAPARVRAMRARANQWRLGFDALQRQLRHQDQYLPVPSHPTNLMHGTFGEFCIWAAHQKGLEIPAGTHFDNWEQQGKARWLQVCQHELVRHLFRRPLEIWLLLDYVLFLEEKGYDVEVGEFCSRALTPRNLFLDARKQAIAPPAASGAR